jgi:hypothetical protein
MFSQNIQRIIVAVVAVELTRPMVVRNSCMHVNRCRFESVFKLRSHDMCEERISTPSVVCHHSEAASKTFGRS